VFDQSLAVLTAFPARRQAVKTAEESRIYFDLVFTGLIALLAISERTIRASRRHIPAKRFPRKAFPLSLKTLGDHLHMKRLEKGFSAKELAQKVNVAKSMIGLWERDVELPKEREWQLLENLLDIDAHLKSMKLEQNLLDAGKFLFRERRNACC